MAGVVGALLTDAALTLKVASSARVSQTRGERMRIASRSIFSRESTVDLGTGGAMPRSRHEEVTF